jgi:hypothetical protein
VGALIASRRPENPIGWMCLAAGLFWMLIVAGNSYTAYVLARGGSPPDPGVIDAVTQAIWCPPWGCSGSTWSCCSPTGGYHRAGGGPWPDFLVQ